MAPRDDQVMGNNEGDVKSTLKQRGGVYGDYADVLKARSTIMAVLSDRYQDLRGHPMPPDMESGFQDLVLKLVRGAGAPHYSDSFHDLAGYATLMEDLSLRGNFTYQEVGND